MGHLKGLLFRTTSLAKDILFANSSPGKSMSLGNFGKKKVDFGNSCLETLNLW